MTAITFSLTSIETGAQRGAGVICAGAMYASVLWAGDERIDRLHVTAADWKELLLDIGSGLPPGPIPTNSRLYMLLAGEHAGYVYVQWVAGMPIKVERPDQVVTALDGLLRQVKGGVS